MKLVLKIALAILLLLVLLGAGGFVWASGKKAELLSRTIETRRVDFPIPWPLTESQIAERGLTPDEAAAEAEAAAVERGRHLAQARYGCQDCHGADFGGGVMMEAGPVAMLYGPNLTLGEGGVTAGYSASDWDRAVRHGVLPDGRPSVMPAQDYQLMSDQELGDLVTYIRTFPPVDSVVDPVTFGPVGTFLLARGDFPFAADLVEDHFADRPALPPEAGVTLEFGRHTAAVCVGCHMSDFAGGDTGNPSWPLSANITPHEDGLAGWTYDNFRAAMLEGRSKDGAELREPMTFVLPFANRMTDTELEAMWLYLQSLPAVASTED